MLTKFKNFFIPLCFVVIIICCQKEYSREETTGLKPCHFILKDKGIYIMAGGERRPYLYFNNHFVLVELGIHDQFNIGDTIHF